MNIILLTMHLIAKSSNKPYYCSIIIVRVNMFVWVRFLFVFVCIICDVYSV